MVEDSDSIRIKRLPPLNPGKIVGKREHQRIIRELDQLRERSGKAYWSRLRGTLRTKKKLSSVKLQHNAWNKIG